MTTDPRDLHGGGIAGPGGPRDEGGVIIDAERAVLPDGVTVSTIDDHELPLAALVIEGRVNKSRDRVRLAFILNPDAAAALITELVALGSRDLDMRRAGGLGGDVPGGFGAQLRVALDDRMAKLQAEGHA